MLKIIVLVLFVSNVVCNECVTYTFEENFLNLFDNTEVPCHGLPFWTEREYSSIGLESPHENSKRFISPVESLSCASSFPFTMAAGGTVEVNVYIDSGSIKDQITIFASQVVEGGNDVNVGSALYHPLTANYATGWQTLKINISSASVGNFDGYLTFMGLQETGSTVLVDSLRFIAPNLDADSCILYEEENNPTTLAPINTEIKPINDNGCLKYTFEDNFVNLFDNSESPCYGLPFWTEREYSSIGLESPHENSKRFISPVESLSCASSFPFTMAAGGTVEVNVYIDSGSIKDQITIFASQVVEGGNDANVGSALYHPLTANYATGWQTLKINISSASLGNFDGYLTFMGLQESGSTVLVDSFRFKDPNLDEDSCILYEEENKPTTLAPATGNTDMCIRYTFEEDFDLFFHNNAEVCFGMTFWKELKYSNYEIESPNVNSTRFISPLVGLSSCASSFPFTMSAGGIVEVNVYMDGRSTEQIVVLVNQIIPNGYDRIIGRLFYHKWAPNFVSGWHTLRLILDGVEAFDGYITFQSKGVQGVHILIDSFRYIAPNLDEDSCILYEEGNNPTTIAPNNTEIKPINDNGCLKYTFEENFVNLFDNSESPCYGLTFWTEREYSSIGLESPHENSKRFISPVESLSCASSFPFTMTADGTVEVNVYIKSASTQDQIIILASQVVEGGYDANVGLAYYYPLSGNYTSGWQTLKINIISGSVRNFEGYLTFMGLQETGSTVLVDSFRFIAPTLDEDSCILYEEDNKPTTVAPITETELTNDNGCVKYNFEKDFEKYLNNEEAPCFGVPFWEEWEYSSIGLNSPNANSKRFISPLEYVSCASSSPFSMSVGGTLEVNVYMDSVSLVDKIAVLVSQVAEDGNDPKIGSALLFPLDANYVSGWHTLRLNISTATVDTFKGYVSFMGLQAPGSTVLVDSFRYIDPNVDKDSCTLYDEEN